MGVMMTRELIAVFVVHKSHSLRSNLAGHVDAAHSNWFVLASELWF